MGWDSSRPVPWRRLLREYAIYAVIMSVVLVVINKGEDVLPLIVAVLMAAPIFIGLGAVLAKFGYQRKTLAELRTPRASSSASSPSEPVAATGPRARPAPTRRTSTGRNQPQRPPRRKR